MSAATVADVADFSGSWDLGITVVGLGGLRRYRAGIFFNEEPYSEDDYTQTTRATYEQRTQQLDLVQSVTHRPTRLIFASAILITKPNPAAQQAAQ